MGVLALWLQTAIAEKLPARWHPRTEAPILPRSIADRYGFSPCADLLLESDGRRVVVELEISRADPVANHVKFLIARDAGELSGDDLFVSMMSPHIVPGRRNVGAAFAQHMRAEGHRAFQVSLLPRVPPEEIKLLNHSAMEVIGRRHLPVGEEANRLLSVIEHRGERQHRIHFAGDVAEVMSNLWAWNGQIAAWTGRRRRVQYFVHDPQSGNFAPSKFCAFIPALARAPDVPPTMNLEVYSQLGESDPRFDGNVARRHLVQRLAFQETPIAGALEQRFNGWLALVDRAIAPRSPVHALLPPGWYR